MAYPTTHEAIRARLTTIDTLLQAFEDGPAKFAELIGGSVHIKPLDYVMFLERQRDLLRKQLNEIPYWRGSTPETTNF